MEQSHLPQHPADQHRLMERMASARISEDRAREIITSKEAHRAFIAELCNGMAYAAVKRR